MGRIREAYSRIRDVAQFNEFLFVIIVRAVADDHIGRMIHQLANHDWANQWVGVGEAKRFGALRNKMFFPAAGNITAKTHAAALRAKSKTMHITSQIGVSVS